LYLLQNQWASKVAIDSSLSGDFYVILDSGRGEDQIHVTFVENPLMCWIWWGGTLIGLSTLVALWPVRFKNAFYVSSNRILRTEIHEPIVGAPPPHVYPLPQNTTIRDSNSH
jgi:cytochrome c biogenesis factor